MQKIKSHPIDWDAAAEAERFGALAVSRRKRNRRAKMAKDGLTTAQKAVCMESVVNLVSLLKRLNKPLHLGKTTLELSQRGAETTVAIHGL
jgi:hypothetical protein